MAALHITKDIFETEVLQSDKTVLVDFWATWCGPCQMLLPVIEELSEELTDVKVCKINVDEEPELAQRFHIVSIPTLMVVKNGEVVSTAAGVQPKTKILQMLK
ncbi:MAG: thioredoxin [Lachnospiraceae bacterium]